MAAQAQPEVQAAKAPKPRRRGDWEFLWRFIAVAMLFAIGWVVWIAIQISTPPITLPAAYDAAAKARAVRNVEGQIRRADPAPAAETPPAAAAVPVPAAAPALPREPPVNLDKLKLSDSIETPISGEPATSAKQPGQ